MELRSSSFSSWDDSSDSYWKKETIKDTDPIPKNTGYTDRYGPQRGGAVNCDSTHISREILNPSKWESTVSRIFFVSWSVFWTYSFAFPRGSYAGVERWLALFASPPFRSALDARVSCCVHPSLSLSLLIHLPVEELSPFSGAREWRANASSKPGHCWECRGQS